jgi:hypothetical protein
MYTKEITIALLLTACVKTQQTPQKPIPVNDIEIHNNYCAAVPEAYDCQLENEEED